MNHDIAITFYREYADDTIAYIIAARNRRIRYPYVYEPFIV